LFGKSCRKPAGFSHKIYMGPGNTNPPDFGHPKVDNSGSFTLSAVGDPITWYQGVLPEMVPEIRLYGSRGPPQEVEC